MPAPPIRFAILHSHEARIELGWRPRDARMRMKAKLTYDNWLVVHGRIACAAGQWEFADQSLMEHEAETMARFLLRRPWPDEASTESMESLITFEARGMAPDGLRLHMRFCGEAGPRWLWDEDHDTLWRVGVTAELTISEPQIRHFAHTWLEMLGTK